MFNSNDKKILLYAFNEFCIDEQGYSVSTTTSYFATLDIFFDKVIINKVRKNDYLALFDNKNLTAIRSFIKNNALRATFLSFLDFLHKEEFIETKTDYLTIKDRIIHSIEGTVKKNQTKKDYFSPKTLKSIFTNPNLLYLTDEERYVTPLLASLSFFCLYKQGDIFKLKVSDVNLENRTIRNIRYNNTINITEFISMNDTFYNIMKNYIEYRNQLNNVTDYLIIVDNKPVSMNGINNLFGIYKRNENNAKLHIDSIGCELFIKSMMYYLLTYKGEEGLISIFRIIEKENQYFKYAFNDYIESKRAGYSVEPLHIFDLEDLLPQNKDQELQILKEDNKNSNSSTTNQELDEDEFLSLFEPYSVEQDLNFEDLEAFELNSTQNHSESKIQIQRLVRNSTISEKLKKHYEFRCQICSYRVPKSDGSFLAEAHHIQPYNRLHKGDDTTQNLIILCPNCHTQFDDLYFAIEPETLLIHSIIENDDYHLSELTLKHTLGNKYLNYNWELFQDKKRKIHSLKIPMEI